MKGFLEILAAAVILIMAVAGFANQNDKAQKASADIAQSAAYEQELSAKIEQLESDIAAQKNQLENYVPPVDEALTEEQKSLDEQLKLWTSKLEQLKSHLSNEEKQQ